MIVSAVSSYCSDLTLHSLVTLCLLIFSSYGKINPLVKLLMSKLSAVLFEASKVGARSLLQRVRSAVSTLLISLMVKAMVVTSKMCGPTATLSPARSTTSQEADTSEPLLSPACPSAAGATDRSARTGMFVATVPSTVQSAGGTSPDTNAGGSLFMLATQLGNTVMLASMELQAMDGVVPALMDNGASNGTSCSRTLDGAVPGTFDASDAGNIGLGSEGAVLV